MRDPTYQAALALDNWCHDRTERRRIERAIKRAELRYERARIAAASIDDDNERVAAIRTADAAYLAAIDAAQEAL